MRFEIITIFPGFFAGIFEHGIVRRAQAQGLVAVGMYDLREFTHDRHRTVDDRPFGGGEGMVLKPEPLAEALGAMGIVAKAEREAMWPPSLSPQVRRKDGASGSVPDAGPDSAPDAGLDSGGTTRVILLSAQGRPFT